MKQKPVSDTKKPPEKLPVVKRLNKQSEGVFALCNRMQNAVRVKNNESLQTENKRLTTAPLMTWQLYDQSKKSKS